MKRKITIATISVYLTVFSFAMRQVGLLTRYANILLPLIVLSAFLISYNWDCEPLARLLTNQTLNDSLSKWVVKLEPVEE